MRKTIRQYNIVVGIFLLFVIGFFQFSYACNIEVYFSPDDNPEEVIISLIDNSQDTLDIAMYYFTDREISQAVVRAHERGVIVRIYLDKSQVHTKYSSSRYLVKNRVPIRISSNNHIMHDKFAVIDNKIVLTGSYNWTVAAEKYNDENLVVITDNDTAKRYEGKFMKFIKEKVDWKKTCELYRLDGFKYIGSTKSNKYHYPWCWHAERILMENEFWFRSIKEAIEAGYEPCKVCNPPIYIKDIPLLKAI